MPISAKSYKIIIKLQIIDKFSSTASLGCAVEDGASIYVLALGLSHGARARLDGETAGVATTCQLRLKERPKLFRLHLLRSEQEQAPGGEGQRFRPGTSTILNRRYSDQTYHS